MDSFLSQGLSALTHSGKKDDQHHNPSSESHHPENKDPHNPSAQSHHPGNKDHHPTNSELLASAKIVAEAARSGGKGGNKGEIAGAAANLLDGAQKYGKLDENAGVGKYMEKAEDYLHGYHSTHTKTTTTKTDDKTGHSATTTTTTTTVHATGDGDSGSGGFGDYMKMAEGFMKKN